MADRKFPPLDYQTAAQTQIVVVRAKTVADLGIAEIRYFLLFATCDAHGEFSAAFSEDELARCQTETAGDAARPLIPCPECATVPPMNLRAARSFMLVPNPYKRAA